MKKVKLACALDAVVFVITIVVCHTSPSTTWEMGEICAQAAPEQRKRNNAAAPMRFMNASIAWTQWPSATPPRATHSSSQHCQVHGPSPSPPKKQLPCSVVNRKLTVPGTQGGSRRVLARPGHLKTLYAKYVVAHLSTSRTMPGGFADRAALPKGTNGRPLCRWCSLEVPPRRFTFCSDWCVHEGRLRSDPGYLRDRVGKRHG